jgi:hypothetical protein
MVVEILNDREVRSSGGGLYGVRAGAGQQFAELPSP